MSIRIHMHIKNLSPFLATISGIIKVEYTDYSKEYLQNTNTLILECEFNKKTGQTGYKNSHGFRSDLFEAIKPQLDVMLHSYMAGLTLEKDNYSWVDDSLGKTFDEWSKEKGINSEIPEQKTIKNTRNTKAIKKNKK